MYLPRHARRRWSPGAAVALAAVGLCLTVAGGTLVLRPLSVPAEPFHIASPARTSDAAATTGSLERGDAREPTPPGVSSSPSPTAEPDSSAAAPRTLSFPAHGITAALVPVGVLPSGALQLPREPQRVGWWAAGALPGAGQGSAVLAGHMDGSQRLSAMRPLLRVRPGELVEVTDSAGDVHVFAVTERIVVSKQQLEPGLFTRAGQPRLVLITCGGSYDPKLGYHDNIVVIAVPTER